MRHWILLATRRSGRNYLGVNFFGADLNKSGLPINAAIKRIHRGCPASSRTRKQKDRLAAVFFFEIGRLRAANLIGGRTVLDH